MGSIWIALIHVLRRVQISSEVTTSLIKRTCGYINITDDVERKPIECEDEKEEDEICDKLEEI